MSLSAKTFARFAQQQQSTVGAGDINDPTQPSLAIFEMTRNHFSAQLHHAKAKLSQIFPLISTPDQAKGRLNIRPDEDVRICIGTDIDTI